MKTIIQSIRPEHTFNMRHAGKLLPKKRIEVRKTAPKEIPFKVLIYETKQEEKSFKSTTVDGVETRIMIQRGGCGKVIGEYICRKVETVRVDNAIAAYYNNNPETRISDEQLIRYSGGKDVKFLYMEDVVFYDKPKELEEFKRNSDYCDDCKYLEKDIKVCKKYSEYLVHNELLDWYYRCEKCLDENCLINRPPQSWCYVEE